MMASLQDINYNSGGQYLSELHLSIVIPCNNQPNICLDPKDWDRGIELN
ncbi:hypothetical protein [Bacillus sp. LL01]|nr:hypothetical protein [Bacillus sp. LL01]